MISNWSNDLSKWPTNKNESCNKFSPNFFLISFRLGLSEELTTIFSFLLLLGSIGLLVSDYPTSSWSFREPSKNSCYRPCKITFCVLCLLPSQPIIGIIDITQCTCCDLLSNLLSSCAFHSSSFSFHLRMLSWIHKDIFNVVLRFVTNIIISSRVINWCYIVAHFINKKLISEGKIHSWRDR